MLEYHNQNFNTPKQTTIGGQLKSLGDKFRKVANLDKNNTLTLNDMDGLMNHVTIPTNPNMFKNTKDFANLTGTNNDNNKWGNFGSAGAIVPLGERLYNNKDIKTSVYHFYTTPDGYPCTEGLSYYGYLSLKKGHVYTISFYLCYQEFPGFYEGHPDTWNDGWIDYPFCFYGFYTTNKNDGQPLIQVDRINKDWRQYCLSFVAPVDSDPNTDIQWWFQSYTNTRHYPGGSLYIANVKMEEGDLATLWCE